MTEEKTIGLLLQSIPYLGKKKIFKIFTRDHGLISLFVRSTPLSPFCIAEWVYHKGQKEIHTLKDSSLLDPLLFLRESYAILSAAGSIAQDLLRTQFPDKGAPELFDLVYLYLKNLPANPQILAASFRLKLLFHEGLLSTEPFPSFTPTEWEQVSVLAFSRQLSMIQSQKSAPFEKINALFEERLSGI